jgi:SAM-dependent methyltransferase
MQGHIDFGYPWWLSYGHLIIVIPAVLLLAAGIVRRWPVWALAFLGFVTLWSASAFFVARFVLNINGPAALPTEAFLKSGSGRVLDMGAGTGRSSIMVLRSRPATTLVALDLFGESYNQHFGPGARPEDRLLSNLKAAGVDERASVRAGDMRRLPFEPATFDAVVSSYAIDHLNRQGIRESLSEAARVLKPGGEFLLMVIGKDRWARFAFGPLLAHMGGRGSEWWSDSVRNAGFQVLETGMRPATVYVLSRKATPPLPVADPAGR